MLMYLKSMLQVVLSPSKGWDDLAAESPSGRRFLLCGFLPLLVFVAVSADVGQILMGGEISTVQMVVAPVVNFAVYALSYFTCCTLLHAMLPRMGHSDAPSPDRIILFATITVGQMAVIGIFDNLLPAELTLLQLLPLLEIAVIARARDFLGTTGTNTGMTVALGIFAVIVPVYLFKTIFSPLV